MFWWINKKFYICLTKGNKMTTNKLIKRHEILLAILKDIRGLEECIKELTEEVKRPKSNFIKELNKSSIKDFKRERKELIKLYNSTL